ncbi:hypothetical protein N8482_03355 [Chitinophagales bacterium]|nr:hypothetical protein [Chitinophagales bacterium]
MEIDPEIKGEGNHYDLGLRNYDPRAARMFSIDPRAPEYPWQTSYAYHRNSPISMLDYLGGGDEDVSSDKSSSEHVKGRDKKSRVEHEQLGVIAWKPTVDDDGNIRYVSENKDSYSTFVEQYGEQAAEAVFDSNCGDCVDKNATYEEGEVTLDSPVPLKLLVSAATTNKDFINQAFFALRFENLTSDDWELDWKVYLSDFNDGKNNNRIGIATVVDNWETYTDGNGDSYQVKILFRGAHDGLMTSIADGRTRSDEQYDVKEYFHSTRPGGKKGFTPILRIYTPAGNDYLSLKKLQNYLNGN